MTDKFDPETSGFEMQLATANMQNAIIDVQNSTAQSLLKSTDAEQANGFAELSTLQEIYNGDCPNGQYGFYYAMNIVNTGSPSNPSYTVTYTYEHVSAPGWNNTNDDTKTQAAANLAQQFYDLGNSGYDAYNQTSSSMLSQDTSNSNSIAQFAKDSSSGQAYIANLLASSLA